MTGASGTRATVGTLLRSFGAWLHPASNFRPRSEPERELQFRVGLVSLLCTVSAIVAIVVAAIMVIPDPLGLDHVEQFSPTALEAALFLVLVSVFAPQAIFRTRTSAYTRQILSNPSAPIQPWRSTTITFDAVLVGAMLAGLYFDAELAALFFGLALIARVVFTTRRALQSDPNARFHNLFKAWTSAAIGGIAFLIVSPLSGLVSIQGSVAPLIFAALVAMYMGLAFNAIERWVSGDRTRWAFARDAVDTRRIIVALVSALIAWVVSYAGVVVGGSFTNERVITGTLAGLGIYLASWLILWFVAIQLWTRDATRTLNMWAAHQAEVTTRLADDSLSPVLAARASIPTTARIAASVFAATKTMVVVDDAHGRVTTHLVAVDLYDNSPRPEPRDLLVDPSMRMELYPAPDHPNMSSVSVAGWLWTGWFMVRQRRIVNRFRELATTALLLPVLAADDDRSAAAFATMFDPVHRWPTMDAFAQAVDAMQQRADDNPHTDSLIMGVFAIDEFGTLEGGRFEQAAIAQVMRLAMGHQDFAGHDLFVAYERPGRVWVALSGGPIIRNGIGTLRGLQQYVNDHGSVPSARLDVEVHVSVSFGYAAHQVDEFTFEGLVNAALSRLAIDHGTRDPFSVENLMTYDITPEDITGEVATPITAVNVLNLLVADHASTSHPFITRFQPVRSVGDDTTGALLVDVGWERRFGSLDLSTSSAFMDLVNRQRRLAAEAARIIVERLKVVFAEADHLGLADLPIIVGMPSSLLRVDANEYALPNLLSALLDTRECARTVLLFEAVPADSIATLRELADRGLGVAVTASAAAAADPIDLAGWPRWGILFPRHIVQGRAGIDALTVQQTMSAIATNDTRLIGVADQYADRRELLESGIGWTIDPGLDFASVREAVGTAVRRSA